MSEYKSDFLNVLRARGFIHQCSDFAALDEKLMQGPQSAYVGYDPTGASLHVGHLYTIMILHWFQKCGHSPITLMGGGTALVGDPSFKDKSRPLLNRSDIVQNIASIKGVFERFIDYSTRDNPARMVDNADWLLHLNYMDFLRDYGTHFTINRMMSFDSVRLRLEREQPLTFLEFNYMILQAYDFVELYKRYGTVLQIGGSDQWGNIINGVDLGHKMLRVQLFGLTAPLLTTHSGAKMGKTEQGAVWLNSNHLSPYDYYQFWRNTEDSDVGRFLKLFTVLPLDEIARLSDLRGQEINEAKKILAYEATAFLHGPEAASTAQTTAQDVFEQGGIGADLRRIEIPTTQLTQGLGILDAFVLAELASSKSEARRLIQSGGARVNDEKITLDTYILTQADINESQTIKLTSGKKKHCLLVSV